MKNRAVKPLMLASALLLVAACIGVSFSWFVHRSETQISGKIGNFSPESIRLTGDGDTPYDTLYQDGGNSFVILNESDVDVYLRLGYTLICMDGARELTTDLSGLEIYDDIRVEISGASSGTAYLQKDTVTQYGKCVLNLTSANGFYYPLPAKSALSGYIELDGSAWDAEGQMHLILVPEVIQATRNAAREAESYGWEPGKANKQADGIAGVTEHD